MAFGTFGRLVLVAALAPLALGLGACSKGKDGNAGLSGDAIAKVAAPAGKAWSMLWSRRPKAATVWAIPMRRSSWSNMAR